MSKFDSELWRGRAWARFQRAVQAGGDTKQLEKLWFVETLTVGDLEAVVNWCGSRGLEVDFLKRAGGIYDHSDKKITIVCGAKPQRQLVYLLHECGHHLIGMKEQHERFGMGYPQTDPELKKTFLHRVSCLEEELEAWHRGWKLGQRLGLQSLTREAFDAIRLECLKTYIKWTLRRGAKEDVDD